MGTSVDPLPPIPVAGPHTRGLAGFGFGVTLSAIVLSLDDVLGSSCFGSGPYLRNCRAAFVPAVALGGALGAGVGRMVGRDSPPGRGTRLLVGSSIGAGAAFVVSVAACAQEDASNPSFLCGYDGMVSTRSVVSGALLGAALGELALRASRHTNAPRVSAVPDRSGGLRISTTIFVGGRP